MMTSHVVKRDQFYAAALGPITQRIADKAGLVIDPARIYARSDWTFEVQGMLPMLDVDARILGQTYHFAPLTTPERTRIHLHPAVTAFGGFHVLAHEALHAHFGFAEGHGPKFQAAAKAIGLTEPWGMTAPGPEFEAWQGAVIRDLPEFPDLDYKIDGPEYMDRGRDLMKALMGAVFTELKARRT